MQFNEYQTELTEELISQYPKEVIDELHDYLNTVPYIQRLVAKDRKYACQLERDEEGKIIVDLANPHILEDMDYFRQAAIHYQKHKTFTKLRVNTHPQSEYMKWFKEEIRRIWNGMVRESDGEWISGDLYIYLNYLPIIQTVVKKNHKGKEYGDRIVDFPEMWEGVYLRFHYLHQSRYGGMYNNWEGGQHSMEISSRGKSKSLSLAAIATKAFITGLGIDSEKCKTLVAAANKEYLIKDGTLNKFLSNIEFLEKNTELPAKKIKSSISEMHWISGWVSSEGQWNGSQNEVLGLAVADDPSKARGKRSNWMLVDEFGSFPKFLSFYQTSIPNVQEGDLAFGQFYAVGTAGEAGSDFMGALEMITLPEGYNVYAIPHVYDKGSNGSKTTIFFFPSYMNYKRCYNKDGVSDVIQALLRELSERYRVKYNSSDPMMLTRRKAEYCITQAESIMRTSSTIYPVADLNDRVADIDNDPTSLKDMFIGKIKLVSGTGPVWTPDMDVNPILTFPHSDNKLEGCVHIKTMPIKEGNKDAPPWGRYVAGADVYDDDTSETLSLFVGYILDLWTDDVVAEYAGRPSFADDAYENWRRLLLLYNAECNYENNKKGLFTYFSRHNCLYLLSDVLEFLKDKDMMKMSYGNKSKGTIATAPIKGYARRCIRDYLLKPIEDVRIELIDGIETEVITSVPNLSRIKFRALLLELAQWNPDGNFDRHDALAMLMLIREDKLRLLGDGKFEERHTISKDYLGNDDYFDRNYNKGKADSITRQLEVLGLLKPGQSK